MATNYTEGKAPNTKWSCAIAGLFFSSFQDPAKLLCSLAEVSKKNKCTLDMFFFFPVCSDEFKCDIEWMQAARTAKSAANDPRRSERKNTFYWSTLIKGVDKIYGFSSVPGAAHMAYWVKQSLLNASDQVIYCCGEYKKAVQNKYGGASV